MEKVKQSLGSYLLTKLLWLLLFPGGIVFILTIGGVSAYQKSRGCSDRNLHGKLKAIDEVIIPGAILYWVVLIALTIIGYYGPILWTIGGTTIIYLLILWRKYFGH